MKRKVIKLNSDGVKNLGEDVTVLVVDDEEISRKVLARMVQRLGLDLLQAVNGQEALDTINGIQEETRLLIVTDIVMPIKSGPDFVARLRGSDSPHSSAPVLFTSGYPDGHENIANEENFLEKPYNFKEFCKALQPILQLLT